jgi:DNA-binding winged helix-turn-helix (wHTH) protein
MNLFQRPVSSLQGQPHRAINANSALAGAQFGAFEVNFLNHELRKNGRRVKLPEKPFQILEVLLEKAGDMVSRDELVEKLWRQTHVNFNPSINTAVNQLRHALNDPAKNPRFIETRYRLGYRFFVPVRTWNGTEPPSHKVGTAMDTIAVMPFDSSGGDSEMKLLSDRVTENVFTCLSGVPGVRVIGSSCVFPFKGPRMEPLAVEHGLHRRAVLTGWIARRRDHVTIATNLLDVPGGWRRWGEQYHLKVSDIFPIETEIPKDICNKVHQGLTEADTYRHGLSCSTDVGVDSRKYAEEDTVSRPLKDEC